MSGKSTVPRLQGRWLAIVGVIFAVLSLLLAFAAARYDWPTPVLPYESLVTLVAVGIIALIFGWRVKRLREKKRSSLSHIFAVRVLLLGQALGYAGAVIAGWHLSLFALLAITYAQRSVHTQMWAALALLGTGILLIVIGYIIEALCKIPPEEPPSGHPGELPHDPAGSGEYASRKP